RQIALGFNLEDEEILLDAMVTSGKEAIGSMGSDIPLAVLSTQAQHISNYFKQQFAQVTNPPIDSIRESPFMSLECCIGGAGQAIHSNGNDVRVIRLKSPVLDPAGF